MILRLSGKSVVSWKWRNAAAVCHLHTADFTYASPKFHILKYFFTDKLAMCWFWLYCSTWRSHYGQSLRSFLSYLLKKCRRTYLIKKLFFSQIPRRTSKLSLKFLAGLVKTNGKKTGTSEKIKFAGNDSIWNTRKQFQKYIKHTIQST